MATIRFGSGGGGSALTLTPNTVSISADAVATSTSYIETGLNVSVTTTSNNTKVLLTLVGCIIPSSTGIATLAVNVAGASDTDYLTCGGSGNRYNASFSTIINVPTAGTNIIRIRLKSSGATNVTLVTSASGVPDCYLSALPLA